MATAELKAVITAEDRASRTLKGVGDQANNLGKTLATSLKFGAIAAAGAIAAFAYTSVKAFEESENAMAQTNAVLKSTGGIAGVTSTQVYELAKSLQRVTKYSDEDVRSAENLLLTFTAISKDIFPDATKTVLDMSTALGQDLKSSSIQLGKALQDPVLGITALRRVGVNFSDAQKQVVQNLVETGHKAQAQKLILQELHTEFGGSAEAAGNTFAGALEKLKNQFNDLQESVGQTIVNALVPLVTAINGFISSGQLQNLVNQIVAVYNAVVTYLAPGFSRFIFILQEVGAYINQWIMPSLMALVNTFIQDVLPSLMKLWNAVEPGFTTALKALGILLGAILIAQIWIFVNAIRIIYSTIATLINIVSNLISWFGNLGGVMINFFKNIAGWITNGLQWVWDAITEPFRKAFEWVVDLYNKTVGKILGKKSIDIDVNYKTKGGSGLPQFAEGTNFAPGGMAIVGERGPELVNLPRGSQVIPNDRIASTGGTQNFVVNIGMYAGTEMEKRKIAMSLMRAYQDAAGV